MTMSRKTSMVRAALAKAQDACHRTTRFRRIPGLAEAEDASAISSLVLRDRGCNRQALSVGLHLDPIRRNAQVQEEGPDAFQETWRRHRSLGRTGAPLPYRHGG